MSIMVPCGVGECCVSERMYLIVPCEKVGVSSPVLYVEKTTEGHILQKEDDVRVTNFLGWKYVSRVQIESCPSPGTETDGTRLS